MSFNDNVQLDTSSIGGGGSGGGGGRGGMVVGGGIFGLIIAVLVMLLGGDPSQIPGASTAIRTGSSRYSCTPKVP